MNACFGCEVVLGVYADIVTIKHHTRHANVRHLSRSLHIRVCIEYADLCVCVRVYVCHLL